MWRLRMGVGGGRRTVRTFKWFFFVSFECPLRIHFIFHFTFFVFMYVPRTG